MQSDLPRSAAPPGKPNEKAATKKRKRDSLSPQNERNPKLIGSREATGISRHQRRRRQVISRSNDDYFKAADLRQQQQLRNVRKQVSLIAVATSNTTRTTTQADANTRLGYRSKSSPQVKAATASSSRETFELNLKPLAKCVPDYATCANCI